jgi:3-hydroxy-9,10-secoandrosta-1,3,5(10)-triene-9,17-dione monooxygenase
MKVTRSRGTRAQRVTPAEFKKRAAALAPIVRERAREAEQMRMQPPETIRDLQEGGLFRGLQPARWGGYEIDPATYYEACVDLGAADASTGWILGVVGVHNWQLGLFPLEAQRDVWGESGTTLVASSYAPVGDVRRVEGGFRVRGMWSFSSGIDYAEWVLTGAILDGADGRGRKEGRTLLIPKEDYRIVDNWHVAGLAASGSKAFVVEDAFVPEYRTLLTRSARKLETPGAEVNTNPLYRLPFMNVFVYAVSAPIIGVAQGMLDFYLQQAKRRLRSATGPLSQDAFAHMRIAKASAAVQAARRQLRADLDELLALAVADEPIPADARARFRWGAAYCVDVSMQAIDELFDVAGGFSIHLDNPLQRMFRDAHAMRAHFQNNVEKAAEAYGRALLGLPDQGSIL